MLNLKRRLLTMACTAGMAGSVFALAPASTAFAAVTEEVEENAEAETANEIDVNTDVKGTMGVADYDWYKVTITDPGNIQVNYTKTGGSWGAFNTKVWIRDESGKDLQAGDFFQNDEKAGKQGSDKIGVVPGTYYIGLFSQNKYYNEHSVEYTINVGYEKSDAWETEGKNESQKTAQQIDTNATVNGTISRGDDADWYKFTLDEQGTISYSFWHELVDSDNVYWKVNLYDKDGRQLTTERSFTDDGGFTGKKNTSEEDCFEYFSHIGLEAGTYYLKVEPYRSNQWWGSTYSVRIDYDKASDWETEWNNDIDTANMIEANKLMNGALSVHTSESNDEDYYKLSVPTKSEITLKFGHEHFSDTDRVQWRVSLLDAKGKEIKDQTYESKGNVTGLKTMGSVELEAGTYYVKVYKGYGWSTYDYSLKVEMEETKIPDGLQKGPDGSIHYYKDGKIDKEFKGYADYDGSKFYVKNGEIDTSLKGVMIDPNADPVVFYFNAGGQVQTQYTGLAEYDGEWFYLENGKVCIDMSAFVDYDGGKFAVAVGRIVSEYSGLMQDPQNTKTGDWYFFANGQAQTQYTGLAEYDGHWFYVVKGKFDPAYNGTVTYDGAEFTVVNGEAVVK